MRFTIDHRHENGWNQVILTDTATGTAATIIPSAGAILNAFSVSHAGKTLQVIDGFLSSAEFSGFVAPVVRLYFATFLRVPDYDGLVFNAGLDAAVTALFMVLFAVVVIDAVRVWWKVLRGPGAPRELAASGPEPVREFLHRGRVGLAVETQ